VGWYGLSQNKPLKEVLRWGVACGSAATMNEGQLFKLEMLKGYLNGLTNNEYNRVFLYYCKIANHL
jgi:fructose-1-phosphate kinase PfkB-like protein